MGSPGFGQQEKIDFIWENHQNNESNGTLLLDWRYDESLDIWNLNLVVNWYDASGEAINIASEMPFIYISEYDLEIKSPHKVKCLNFTVSSNIYEIKFRERGELRFEIPQEIESPGTLEITINYALSREAIDNADIDPVKIPGSTAVSIKLPDTIIPEEDPAENVVSDQQVTPDPVLLENCRKINSNFRDLEVNKSRFRQLLANDDRNIGNIRSAIDAAQPSDSIIIGQYEENLQAYFETASVNISTLDSILIAVGGLGESLNIVRLPEDSTTLYQRQVTRLNGDLRELRGEFVQNRNQIRGLLGDIGSSFVDIQLNNLKAALENDYQPLFQKQLDSIGRIQSSYNGIESALLTEIRKGPSKVRKSHKYSELVQNHNDLKASLDSIYGEHWEDYIKYREGIEETGEIVPLETLHDRFNGVHSQTDIKVNNMDMEITRLEASMNQVINRPVPRGIIVGGGIFLFLFFLILIYRLSRARKESEGKSRRAMITGAAGNDAGFELIEDVLDKSVEYYKIVLPKDNQDLIITEIHLHIRVIKSIYHLIQGALIDKKPEDFGGLLFGRQYKLNGSGDDRHVIIVEKVTPAANIRPDMKAGNDEGAILVEEIDRLVVENKKMALLGWFSSSREKDLQMPENQIKVHRTYFSDKWQIACLIYPGSESMDSGLFVRRKSGFFEPVLSDNFKQSWDELYQFAVNPPDKKEVEQKEKPKPADFVKVELNRNWCDSIVENLYVHPDVLKDINYEKDHQGQLAVGQVANGYLYGEVWSLQDEAGEPREPSYEVFVTKLTVARSNENPRELPGSQLVGWIKFDENEIFESLKTAIPYHTDVFKAAHHVAVLINTQTNETRFFSRKHTMEMNNNTIETEEFNLDSLSAGAEALSSNK